MFEAGGINGVKGAAAAYAASAAAPAPSVREASSTGVTRVALSPRIKSDPAAGIMIAEYLSASGEKQIQIPSEAVVAYLRSGLTAQGVPVRDQAALATEV